jgi:hypothetical protein
MMMVCKRKQRLSQESILKSSQKHIIGNEQSTKVNRLTDDLLIIVIVPINLLYNVSSTTRMHGAGKSQLDIAVVRIGSGYGLAVDSSMKLNLFPISQSDGCSDAIWADFAVDVFPLLKSQILALWSENDIYPVTVSHSLDAPCQIVVRVVGV